MEMADQIALSLYAAASGAGALAFAQAAIRREGFVAGWSAMAFAALLTMNCLINAVDLIRPSAPIWLQSLSAVTLAGLAPLLWMYIDDITSPIVRRWRRSDALKFWTVGLAVFQLGFAMALSGDVINDLSGTPGTAAALGRVYFYFSLLVLLCIVLQSTLYVWQTLRRLSRLSSQLRQLFSDADERRPAWLWLVIFLLSLNWLVTFVYNLGLLPVPSWGFGVLAFAFSVSFNAWSIQQRPAFIDENGARSSDLGLELSSSRASQAPVKYERSLLSADRMGRIAAKIARAFSEDQLHLDPVLSLSKLSKHLSCPEQHLSQTFSRHLDTSFYDYVNLHRIESAKRHLMESDALIGDIAIDVGYNSRSAFYNAFKLVTGQTPSEFRAAGKVA